MPTDDRAGGPRSAASLTRLACCLGRLRELGYVEVWGRDEPESPLLIEHVLASLAAGAPNGAASIFFVDGREIRMVTDRVASGEPYAVVYRGLERSRGSGVS